MNKTKLNPGSIASYDLRPGNGVVTILVEREGMNEIRLGKAELSSPLVFVTYLCLLQICRVL